MSVKTMRLYIFSIAALLSAAACSHERKAGPGDGDNFHIIVKAASKSINQDLVYWEDRVDELRMIAFDRVDGSVVFNQKIFFPNGFGQPSRALRIKPGTYDFYFFANETAGSGNLVTALAELENVSDFSNDQRFFSIDWDPEFAPDGTTREGRFLMSAIYENVAVATGGTETSPVPLPLSTGTVELIRSLAKVQVIFRKKVEGSAIEPNSITSVRLTNVASVQTVPPDDGYYSGATEYSAFAPVDQFDYSLDSIGAATFYIPEFLVQTGGTRYTELRINNTSFDILSDDAKAGLTEQRRSITGLSNNSVIRNYHYLINAYMNAEGGFQIRVYVEPWTVENYLYIFEGGQQVVIPPVIPTDSSIIIPTECGKVEILSENEFLQQGLMGAYNMTINYGAQTIDGGDPPYYCEKKYGPGWRLINSCELLSFLAYCDVAYKIWLSNTWYAYGNPDVPYYARHFREEAQFLLEKLTGSDLSATVLQDENNWQDQINGNDLKVNLIDDYFTPGDIMLRLDDFGGEWPFTAPPGTYETWIYNQASIQVKAFWYGAGYVSLADRNNWDKVLYGEFERFDYSSTVSRCVRVYE